MDGVKGRGIRRRVDKSSKWGEVAGGRGIGEGKDIQSKGTGFIEDESRGLVQGIHEYEK